MEREGHQMMRFSDYNEKLWDIAQTEYDLLKQEDKDYIKLHFSYIHHHFSYGLYLRNKYVSEFPIDNDWDRDALGKVIFNRIIGIMFPAFENNLYIIEGVTLNCDTLNIQFFLKTGDYFINKIGWKEYIKCDEWSGSDPSISDLPKDEAKKKFDEWMNHYKAVIYEQLADIEGFKEKSRQLGYKETEINDIILLSSRIYEETHIYIPLEILFFKNGNSESALCTKSNLMWIAENKTELIADFPEYVKNNRVFAELMISANGHSIEFLSAFIDDYELIKAAVTSTPSAVEYIDKKYVTYEIAEIAARNSTDTLIFYYDSMSDYRDDDNIVTLAIKANGANIAFTSERIRDSYEFAEMALKNQKDIYPCTAYEELSDRLKHDKSLALIEAASKHPDLHSFIDEFLDDDDIAEVLYNSDSRYRMWEMSERIKKKYHINK